MSLSQAKLQEILNELGTSHRTYTTQLQQTLNTVRALDREEAVLKATVGELQSSTTSKEETVWRGVGKMFLTQPAGSYIEELEKEQRDVKERQSAIKKKREYLEVSVQKVEESIKQIVGPRP